MEPNEVQTGLDFFSLIQQGAISTYPLLFCSVLLFGVVLERIWTLRGVVSSTRRLAEKLESLLGGGDLKGALAALKSHAICPARRVFNDILERAERPPVEIEKVAEERQFEEVQGAGAYLWILGTIASSAPFIGLFGTVIGIIRAFHTMAIAGTGGFSVVAAGISEALIATALGLAVGIVALVFYNYLQSRVERIDAALQIGSARVIQALAVGRGDGVR